MIKEGKAYSILTDHLGTPTEAYDAEGNEVWSRTLDMNGEVIEETGNIGMIPFLFQGQYYDREIELAYNRFRYYSPQMGMYISQDPIGLNSGIINIYMYVDDTNVWIDPFGLAPWGRGKRSFDRWWNNAKVKDIKKNIEAVKDHLRGKGGFHEKFPVSAAAKAKSLGFTPQELRSMVLKTEGLVFTFKEKVGEHHKSEASSLFHTALLAKLTDKKLRSKKKALEIIEEMHSKHVVGYNNKK